MANDTHSTPFGQLEKPLNELKAVAIQINLLLLATVNRPEISAELAIVHKSLGEIYEDLSVGIFEVMADSPSPAEVVAIRVENRELRAELEILYENSKTLAVEAAWRNLVAAAREAIAAADEAGMLDIT